MASNKCQHRALTVAPEHHQLLNPHLWCLKEMAQLCLVFFLAWLFLAGLPEDSLRSSKLKDGHGKEQLTAVKTRHCNCFPLRYTWLTLGSIPFCCSLLFSLRYLFTFLASNANCFSSLSLLLYPDDFAAAKRSSVSPLGCLLLLLLFKCFAICDIESS